MTGRTAYLGPPGTFSEVPAAAVCSQRAADGRAEILAHRVQDRPDNTTRFIVLAPLASSPSTGED